MAFQGFCSLTEEWINTAIDSCVDPGLFLPFSTFHCHPQRRCNSFWAVLPQTIWYIHMDALPGLSGARGPLTGNLSWSRFAGGENLHPADRFQSQTPPQRQGPGQAFFISWKPGVSDLINPKKAVRDGPCREGWPKLWFLSGQGSPSRTNRKRSLSIMYSHWEQVNSPLFSSKYWIQDLKLVLAQCDPKIKSNGMSLLIRSLEIWFGWIFRLKCWIPPRVSHWFFPWPFWRTAWLSTENASVGFRSIPRYKSNLLACGFKWKTGFKVYTHSRMKFFLLIGT